MLEKRTIWCLMGITFLAGIRLTVLGFQMSHCLLFGVGVILIGIILTILGMVVLAIIEEDEADKLPSSIWYGN